MSARVLAHVAKRTEAVSPPKSSVASSARAPVLPAGPSGRRRSVAGGLPAGWSRSFAMHTAPRRIGRRRPAIPTRRFWSSLRDVTHARAGSVAGEERLSARRSRTLERLDAPDRGRCGRPRTPAGQRDLVRGGDLARRPHRLSGRMTRGQPGSVRPARPARRSPPAINTARSESRSICAPRADPSGSSEACSAVSGSGANARPKHAKKPPFWCSGRSIHLVARLARRRARGCRW